MLFSHSITVRGLALSALASRCVISQVFVQQCNKTPATVIWSEPLKICCRTIVTQWRPTVEQSARKFRNPPLQVKERTWVNRKLITVWQQNCELDLVQSECHTGKSSVIARIFNSINRNLAADLRSSRKFCSLIAISRGVGKCRFPPADAHTKLIIVPLPDFLLQCRH